MTDLSQIPQSTYYQSGQMKVPGAGVPLPPFVRRQTEANEFLAGAVQRLIQKFPVLFGQPVEPNEKGVDVP